MNALAFKINALSADQLSATAATDEITLILSVGTKPSSSVAKILAHAVPALERKAHYLTGLTGFFSGTSKPWIAPVFNDAGNNGLERRWVFHDWAKNIQNIYAARKLLVYLDGDCTPEDLVRVEDLVTLFSDPLYEGSKWTSVRVFADQPNKLLQNDPQYDLRFTHQLNYRKWVNENPDSLTSIEMGARLHEFAKQYHCEFKTLDESALRDQDMNLLLAVGQGAKKSPSRLHIVGHNLRPDKKPIALIGKGITFDSGGINLKAHENLVNCMKNDMGGAALFSQLFMGLVKSGYSEPLLLAIPCCENATDANSMKPGVIIKSRNGKSVIVEHTDAEGRLILADAMSYVADTYSPSHSFTAATLTTASLRQFANYFTPVHFATEAFRNRLDAGAAIYGELFTYWDKFLPFLQGNKTNAADLTNMGRLASHASMGGGSNVAAHFLREFAGGPYTHLDIFNTIWNWSGDYPGAHYGCTGSVFNSLWHAFKQP